MKRIMIVALVAFMGICTMGCLPMEELTPYTTPMGPASTAGSNPACSDLLRWDGRSQIRVVTANSSNMQSLLDNGNAIELGFPGFSHVAGHFSSHGSIFKDGPNLQNGDWIEYDCHTYKVTGRGSGKAGSTLLIQEGLTIQYSGCGSVCFVYAKEG